MGQCINHIFYIKVNQKDMYQGYQLLIKLIHFKFDTDNWDDV